MKSTDRMNHHEMMELEEFKEDKEAEQQDDDRNDDNGHGAEVALDGASATTTTTTGGASVATGGVVAPFPLAAAAAAGVASLPSMDLQKGGGGEGGIASSSSLPVGATGTGTTETKLKPSNDVMLLMRHLQSMFPEAPSLNLALCQQLLEASNGNMDMAVSFYRDNFGSEYNNNNNNNNNNKTAVAAAAAAPPLELPAYSFHDNKKDQKRKSSNKQKRKSSSPPPHYHPHHPHRHHDTKSTFHGNNISNNDNSGADAIAGISEAKRKRSDDNNNNNNNNSHAFSSANSTAQNQKVALSSLASSANRRGNWKKEGEQKQQQHHNREDTAQDHRKKSHANQEYKHNDQDASEDGRFPRRRLQDFFEQAQDEQRRRRRQRYHDDDHKDDQQQHHHEENHRDEEEQHDDDQAHHPDHNDADDEGEEPFPAIHHNEGLEDDDAEDDDDDDDGAVREVVQAVVQGIVQAEAAAADAVPDAVQVEVAAQNDNNNAAAAVAVANVEREQPREREDAIAGSVSVSDDEGVWRMDGNPLERFNFDNNDNDLGLNLRRRLSDAPANLAVLANALIQIPNHNALLVADAAAAGETDVAHNDESYLSDDDWLTGCCHKPSTPTPPLAILWGLPTQNDQLDNPNEQDLPCIPRTWLQAGFTMASCGGGLITKTPTAEDISFHRWKQQQQGQNDTRNIVLPPFHCKAVTAILSVVNAVIMTGASIQGNVVDCSSSRTPFCELSDKERIKQFDTRLADAIAAILFVALKASVARKQRAISTRQKQARSIPSQQQVDDYDRMKQQTLRRRLRLCPTCRWEEDPNTGEERLPEVRDAARPRLVQSFTNVADLYAYVQSNMRSFTGPGGVALLLETIVRIHGKGTVERMYQKCHPTDNNTTTTAAADTDDLVAVPTTPLITCTCNARKIKIKAGNKHVLDTTPPGHDCLSTELLSLLICGEMHSTFKGWSSGPLGFGILSNMPGQIGTRLQKPSQSVWILRGATCHTLVWVDTSRQHSSCTMMADKTLVYDAMDDRPGAVLKLSHWNFWYGLRNFSSFRLIAARGVWSPPRISKVHSAAQKSVLDRILERKRLQKQQHTTTVVSADELDDCGIATTTVTPEDLDRVLVNQDDMQFYPKDYRRWHYKFLHPATTHDVDATAASDTATNTSTTTTTFGGDSCDGGGGGWVAYHALDDRQRLLVETKQAPRINPILWSRWPNAVIDKFSPDDSFPNV